jgi:Glycosyl hydrolase family 1
MVGFAHAMMYAKVTTAHSDNFDGDQDAARNQFDYFYNWHMLDTVIDGHLDTAIARREGSRQYLDGADFADFVGLDPNTPWKAHCDFVGLNYYRSVYVFADWKVSYALGLTGGRFDNDLHTSGQTHQLLNPLGWEINPAGFGMLMRELNNRYRLPVLVTENGIPQADDRTRGAFIAAHLTELLAAVAAGVDVRGYLYWTLADNWELQEGFRPDSHFGLFTVDRSQQSQPRYLTAGAQAYAYAIATNGVAGIRDRFGVITPGGDQVRPQRMSPALLTGTLDGHPFEVALYSNPDERLCGLLWEQATGQLHRVGGQFNPATRTVTLRHPAGASAGVGDLAGQQAISGTGEWSGTLVRDGATLSWTARTDTLVGMWDGEGALPRVHITHAPGGARGYVGAWMGDQLPRGWGQLGRVSKVIAIR